MTRTITPTIRGYKINVLRLCLTTAVDRAERYGPPLTPWGKGLIDAVNAILPCLPSRLHADDIATLTLVLTEKQYRSIQTVLSEEIFAARKEGRTGTPYPMAVQEVSCILEDHWSGVPEGRYLFETLQRRAELFEEKR